MQQEEIKLQGENISIFLKKCNEHPVMQSDTHEKGGADNLIDPNYLATLREVIKLQQGGITEGTIKEATKAVAEELKLDPATKLIIEQKLLSNFREVVSKKERPSAIPAGGTLATSLQIPAEHRTIG